MTLSQVATHASRIDSHFCKLFKKSTGLTLTEYVARARIEKAKSLLMDPAMRISDVVFAAGFGLIPQFNSVFKEMIGMSPTTYRIEAKERRQG